MISARAFMVGFSATGRIGAEKASSPARTPDTVSVDRWNAEKHCFDTVDVPNPDKPSGPTCPQCGSDNLSVTPYDLGVDWETGYHDAGERFHCHNCGAAGDADEIKTAETKQQEVA